MTVLNSTLLSATNKVRTWTLYGEEYDFTHFFKAHPGGELALKMVEGKDCTSFFEQYHLRYSSFNIYINFIYTFIIFNIKYYSI